MVFQIAVILNFQFHKIIIIFIFDKNNNGQPFINIKRLAVNYFLLYFLRFPRLLTPFVNLLFCVRCHLFLFLRMSSKSSLP